MFSDDYPCYACQCTPDFNGTDIVNNPNCELRRCGIYFDIYRFINGCVPIYYGKDYCCPSDWRCRKLKINYNLYDFKLIFFFQQKILI